MPISAAFSTCSGVPARTSHRPPAAIAQAEPTSPWQDHGPRDRGVLLDEDPDSGCGQQEADHAVVVSSGDEG
jgi:hypothetical protein